MKTFIQAALFWTACSLTSVAGANTLPPTPMPQPSPSSARAVDRALNETMPSESLADYHARFLNGRTAGEMEAFIEHYKNNDPSSLVPRAMIRMRTFAAFEQALYAGQCEEARKLHQRISGYKVMLPYSHASCKQERTSQGTDPEILYMAGVRLQDDGEHASARTLFRVILDRFPKHPAPKAADRLAYLSAPETLDQTARAASAKQSACPGDLGYIRSQMVFDELRNNPSFDEPIDGIIRKAGGLDAAIAELQRLIRENERALGQASRAVRQDQTANPGDDALATRCAKPDGGFCSANYYYHLLKEGAFYYAELLNGLRCRKTGSMERAPYAAAPIRFVAPRLASPAIVTAP